MLIAGGGQAYESSNCLNHPDDVLVEGGIYCSPHIQVGLGYSGNGVTINN